MTSYKKGMMAKLKRHATRIVVGGLALYLLAVVGSFVLSGCEPSPHAVRAREAEHVQVRLATFNVNFGAAPEESASAIDRIDADVICLQESTPAWEKFASQKLAERFPHVLFHHEEYAGGMAVLSRWPVKEMFYERPPMAWFHGLAFSVDTPLGPAKIMNVHLRPPASGNGGASYLNYFRLSSIHPQEIRFLHERLAREDPTTPLIVVGDFNEGDRGLAVRYLQEHDLRDALASFDTTTTTWHGVVAGISLSERCDRVVVPPQFRCIDAGVLKIGASDHFPVLAVLERAEK